MTKNLLILKEKKLRLEYRFLSAELEEVSYILEQTDKELKEVFENEIRTLNKKEDSLAPKVKDDTKEKNQTMPSFKSKETKSIYYKIVELTHPDKVGDESQQEIFKAATKAYKSGDIGALYNIADDLKVPLPHMSPKALKVLEDKNDNLLKGIENKKQTFGWKWAHAKSEEEKEHLKKFFYKHHGLNEDKAVKNN